VVSLWSALLGLLLPRLGDVWTVPRLRALVLGVLALIVVTLIVIPVIIVLIWPLTDLIAAHDVGVIAGPQRAIHLQEAREAVRTQLLTLGAGVFAAGALVFTARNFALARETLDLTAEGQATDSYNNAMDQLGSEKLDVRIGGIFQLERVSRAKGYSSTVMQILATFIQAHSHSQWPLPEPGPDRTERATRPDVQAALDVIGRTQSLYSYYNRGPIVLTGADLSGADLTGLDPSGVILSDVILTGARFPVNAALPEGWVRNAVSGRLQRASAASGDAR
jgi:Pentapeptide repeats (8 copies)